MRLWLLPVLLCAVAEANPLFRQIPPPNAKLTAQPDEDGRLVWHSPHFRIDSDVELRPDDLARLAQVAESTAAVLRAHPLPLFAPPLKGRPRIAIHGTDETYQKAGGAEGSAGFYIGNTRGTARVVIRAESLFAPPHARPGRLPRQNDEDLVVHELVHLCMHRVNAGIPQWLAEGIAEYFASAHLGGGRFAFVNIDAAVRDHLRIRLNPDDPRIPLLPVAAIATLDSEEWLDYIKALPEERRYHAYSTALVLAHYHLHGGTERLERLRNLLDRASAGDDLAMFLDPATAPAVESALGRYWQPKGLTLRFEKSP